MLRLLGTSNYYIKKIHRLNISTLIRVPLDNVKVSPETLDYDCSSQNEGEIQTRNFIFSPLLLRKNVSSQSYCAILSSKNLEELLYPRHRISEQQTFFFWSKVIDQNCKTD